MTAYDSEGSQDNTGALEESPEREASVPAKKRNKKKNKKKGGDQGDQGVRQGGIPHNPPHFTPLKDKISDSFFEDQDSSEDEGMPDYKIGGYHPVHVGEILLDRYVIIQKLGWGHFSTVWLTKDLKHNSYVAIKVQKSAQHYLEAAYDEVEILDKVASNWQSKSWQASVRKHYQNDPELVKALARFGMTGDTSHCVQLLNSFIHNGPNGKHFVMVFEILGVNFLELIKRYEYRGVPIPLVRKLARQCLIGLDYMHRQCKIIHTDFKPENVVIGLREDEVSEIARTGQLTTTKMFHENAEYIKKLNMKVAGTLDPSAKQAAPQLPMPSMEGLTKKQKQNLKKKMQKKRKKLEQSQMTSQLDEDMDDDRNSSIDLDKVNIDADKIVAEGQAFANQRKKAVTESLDRLGAPQPDTLLEPDAPHK